MLTLSNVIPPKASAAPDEVRDFKQLN